MTTKAKEEFNEKLLKLDELLMEYRLADLKEKYPNLFESLIELFVDKDKIIQQQKEEIEKLKKQTGYSTSFTASKCNNCGHIDCD